MIKHNLEKFAKKIHLNTLIRVKKVHLLKYKYDLDLEFFKYVTNDELDYLVNIMLEQKTQQLSKQPKYLKHYPNHTKYYKSIIAELQYFGGNTLMNHIRNREVLYKEILSDVCDKQLVSYDKNSTVSQIEKLLIFKLLSINIENMSQEDITKFKTYNHFENIDEIKLFKELKTKIFEDSDFFRNITTDLCSSLGKRIFKNTTKYAIPIIFRKIPHISLPLLLKDITDPAYRVTLISCIYIAFLREKYKKYDLQLNQRYYPRIGSIVRCDLIGGIIDHSGIYIGNGRIIEIYNNNGLAEVKEVNYTEFVNSSTLRTGTAIYIAVDKSTNQIIVDVNIATEAKKHLGLKKQYSLLEDNCHTFVDKCLSKDTFASSVFFRDLSKKIAHLTNTQAIDWKVCDVNPF
jgi:uncharacterized protein YaaW (UPF0174 family)